LSTRLDHLVILVRDLERAIEDYGRLGFGVTPGGEHADGLTRNALVPFRDGAYLELVAFNEPESDRDNVWGWRGFLPGGGLVDYCAASEALREDIERLRGLGFEVEDPGEGGRRLPEGEEIRWRSASVRQDGGVLPFLIDDVTPRAARPGRARRRSPQRRNRHRAAGDLRARSAQSQKRSGRPDRRSVRDPQTRGLRACHREPGRGAEDRTGVGRPLDGRSGERRGTRPGTLPRGPVYARARNRPLTAGGVVCCIIRRDGAC
jgi:catechol 2,3-dioxygenase-like lactoylglutathione lyase family enzyme